MIVAIHQPNFFPWLGYFNKLSLSDTFVILDHVEGFYRSTWLTRNRVLNAGRAQWLTLPTHRSNHPVPATGVRIQWGNRVADRTLRVLEAGYARHPHFEEVFEVVRTAYASSPEYIAELNLGLIMSICRRLGLERRVVRSSEMLGSHPRLRDLRASSLLVAICDILGAREYVSGDGSLGYIDPPAFEAAGLAVSFQRFVHPQYPQKGAPAFVSHLSVLDALFNVGFAGVRGLVDRGSDSRDP